MISLRLGVTNVTVRSEVGGVHWDCLMNLIFGVCSGTM
jgi:hypothetical protein